MVANRRTYGPMLRASTICASTLDLEHNAFSRGQPEWGAHLADDLERLCALHDPSTIAAVIVEPVAGSVGVYPRPKGYLERLRAICDQHGILLIFDEVIDRLGPARPRVGRRAHGHHADLMTMAKGLTSAHVPMGAVVCRDGIYEAFMKGPEHVIELFHGYTYSRAIRWPRPRGVAASRRYQEEGIFERVARARALLRGRAARVPRPAGRARCIRNFGLMGAIEMEPWPGQPGKRGFEAMIECYERGVMTRIAADTSSLAAADRRARPHRPYLRDGVRRDPRQSVVAVVSPYAASSAAWTGRGVLCCAVCCLALATACFADSVA